MVVALVIGVVVAGYAGLWLVQTVIGKAMNGADRAIRHKTHGAGRAAMGRSLDFAAPLPRAELVQRIVTAVNAHSSAPVLVAGLYLHQREPDLLVFAVGNKVNTFFRARVDLRDTPVGTSGSYAVIDWVESGADVAGRNEVGKLIERITRVVQEAGGSVAEHLVG